MFCVVTAKSILLRSTNLISFCAGQHRPTWAKYLVLPLRPIFNSNFHEHQHLSFVQKSVFLGRASSFQRGNFQVVKGVLSRSTNPISYCAGQHFGTPGIRYVPTATETATTPSTRTNKRHRPQTVQTEPTATTLTATHAGMRLPFGRHVCSAARTELNGCAYHLAGMCAVLHGLS